MKTLRHVQHLLRPSNKTFIKLSGLLGRFKHPVWVIGAGRSGTTWLCNMMCARQKYRFLFEPLNSSHNPEAEFLPNHFYLRPGKSHQQLKQLTDNVFSSAYFPGSDLANKHKLFDGLLVKDISANLFAHALQQAKPEIDPILIIRNPFAVALSRQNKPEWRWFNEPEEFLKQVNLTVDYLEPYKKLIYDISKTNDFILSQILIWSVIHFVPLQQFSEDQLQIVFYEDLLQDTERELLRLEQSLRNKSTVSKSVVSDDVKYQPSRTTGQSADDLREKSTTEWQEYISKEQIDRGNDILEQFGLGFLYDENGNPATDPSEVLIKIQNKFG